MIGTSVKKKLMIITAENVPEYEFSLTFIVEQIWFQSKDWFLCDRDLHHEKVNKILMYYCNVSPEGFQNPTDAHIQLPSCFCFIRGNVRRGNVRSGKCHLWNGPSGKCSFGELSVGGTVLRGTIRRGTVCRGNVFGELCIGEKSIGEVSVGELSGYYFGFTYIAATKKETGKTNHS